MKSDYSIKKKNTNLGESVLFIQQKSEQSLWQKLVLNIVLHTIYLTILYLRVVISSVCCLSICHSVSSNGRVSSYLSFSARKVGWYIDWLIDFPNSYQCFQKALVVNWMRRIEDRAQWLYYYYKKIYDIFFSLHIRR